MDTSKESADSSIKFTYLYNKSITGGYYGIVLEVPGAASQGETKEELNDNLRLAIKAIFKANKMDTIKEGKRIFDGDMQEAELSLV